jgi:hypothetical protein
MNQTVSMQKSSSGIIFGNLNSPAQRHERDTLSKMLIERCRATRQLRTAGRQGIVKKDRSHFHQPFNFSAFFQEIVTIDVVGAFGSDTWRAACKRERA